MSTMLTDQFAWHTDACRQSAAITWQFRHASAGHRVRHIRCRRKTSVLQNRSICGMHQLPSGQASCQVQSQAVEKPSSDSTVHSGTCALAAAAPALASAQQCAAPALDWLGSATKASSAYNFTAASCSYPSEAPPHPTQAACARAVMQQPMMSMLDSSLV